MCPQDWYSRVARCYDEDSLWDSVPRPLNLFARTDLFPPDFRVLSNGLESIQHMRCNGFKFNRRCPTTLTALESSIWWCFPSSLQQTYECFKAGPPPPPHLSFWSVLTFCIMVWKLEVEGHLVWKLHKKFKGKVGQMCHRSCSLV